MDFILGLGLTLTDNATAGINNAINSLNRLAQVAEGASSSLNQTVTLSALSDISTKLGTGFINAGKGILGFFSNMINQTKAIGQEFEGFDVTLTALFGSTSDSVEEAAKKSQEALTKLFDFAKKSPLEVRDVKDMIVTLQSQGINAFDKTTGAITGTRQEFLAFLTDLKSFKPEVANERFKMAIQNYIGSGEKKMMRTVFDMGDIEQIIGHAVSDTAEGRMQDIVEMVEKKGLTGLSESMAKTWQGVASNVSDAFTQIYYAVANAGVFDKLKDAFMGIANQIIDIDPERLRSIGETLAGGLSIIVDPLVKISNIIGDFVGKIIELSETNPGLVKLMMTFGALVGILLTLVGIALKVTSAFSGVSLMFLAMGKQMGSITTLFTTGIKRMTGVLLPFMALLSLFAIVWKSDFMGIRSTVTEFASDVSDAFARSRELVDGSLGDMRISLKDFNTEDSFFDGLTFALMRLRIVFKALSEGWNDFTLSEDTFKKAEELGVLPLIEAIFDLKYRFDNFKEGFIKGWEETNKKLKEVFGNIRENLKGTVFEKFFDTVTAFFQKLSDNDPEAWKSFGESIGKIAPYLLIVIPLFNILRGSVTKLPKALRSLTKSGDEVSKAGNKMGGVSSKFTQVGLGILMLAGAVFLFVKSAQLLASSGAGTVAVFVIMVGAVAGLTVALGKFAPVLEQNKMGLIAFGASLLLAGIGMVLFANACTTISESGMGAVVVFALMLGGLIGLVAVVSTFGSKLTEGAVGLVILGAGLMLCAGAMAIITNSAIALSSAGMGAYVALAVLIGVVTAIAVACSVFAGALIVGGAALAVFGAGLVVVGAGLLLCSASLLLVSASLPLIATYGLQASTALIALSVGLTLVGASAVIAGTMSLLAVAGIGALAVAVLALKLALGHMDEKMKTIAQSIVIIATTSATAGVGLTALAKVGTSGFKALQNEVKNTSTAFSTLASNVNSNMSSISSSFSGMVSFVKGEIDKLKGATNFTWELPKLKLPVFSVSGKFSADPPSVPTFNQVGWHAKGGIFDSPSIIGVGEAGKEAVVPLENNLGWIASLSKMISAEILSANPTNVTNVSNQSSGGYITNNSNSTSNVSNNNDNSVVFSAGSIVINVQNASEEEARRLAQRIMELISRKQEIDKMMLYN